MANGIARYASSYSVSAFTAGRKFGGSMRKFVGIAHPDITIKVRPPKRLRSIEAP
jgi:hypothetical protein